MADILADYREWRQQQEARVSTHSDGCHMWHKDCMIHRLADALAVEQAKRTLTDAERRAIERARQTFNAIQDLSPTETADDAMAAATLRGLLERTQQPSGASNNG
jgi:hypothetical protein